MNCKSDATTDCKIDLVKYMMVNVIFKNIIWSLKTKSKLKLVVYVFLFKQMGIPMYLSKVTQRIPHCRTRLNPVNTGQTNVRHKSEVIPVEFSLK